MRYLYEYNSFKFDIGDKVIIHYWYNNMLTPVEIVSKVGSKFEITHNVEGSEIFNAPNEIISKNEIIDYLK